MVDVAVRAADYDIPGVTVDGTDVLAVHETTQQAVQRMKAGEGATLEQIEREIESAVEEAIAFAKDSPLPKPEDALLDVFAP